MFDEQSDKIACLSFIEFASYRIAAIIDVHAKIILQTKLGCYHLGSTPYVLG
jgi:hypothetical protein